MKELENIVEVENTELESIKKQEEKNPESTEMVKKAEVPELETTERIEKTELVGNIERTETIEQTEKLVKIGKEEKIETIKKIETTEKKTAMLNLTEGDSLTLILRFAFPMLLGTLFQQFYGMMDTIIVGKMIGLDALAGVGSTGAINFMINGFVIGTCSGTVKKALEALPQVEKAEVSHETGKAVVTLKEAVADEVLKKAVEDQEYTVKSIS